jgi:cytochrome c oxidase assembly protein subunit 16
MSWKGRRERRGPHQAVSKHQQAITQSPLCFKLHIVVEQIDYNTTCASSCTPDERRPNMAVFPSKRFRSSSYNGTMPARYRALLAKHPFALFGLPFIATMVLGSFFLTPATAIRYEKHDRKVKQLSKDEELGIGKDRRRIDLKEEYYVRTPPSLFYRVLSDSKRRDWLPKISTTGSKRESRDYPANTTAFSRLPLRPLFSFFLIAYMVSSLILARRWSGKIMASRETSYITLPR